MTDYLTAVHESGHATVASLLHAARGAGPITIEAFGESAGLCFAGRGGWPTVAEHERVGRPYPLVSARLRRFYESRAMVLLAGQAAEDLYAVRGDVMVPVPEAEPEAEADPEVYVLPARDQEALEWAAASSTRNDLDEAMKVLTWMAMSHDLTARHAAFLQGETERVLAQPLAGRMIRTLAAELMVHKTLSARRWKAILAAVR